MDNYDSTITFWNDIFSKYQAISISGIKLQKDLEAAISWVSISAEKMLDYGCGSGTMLFKCFDNKNVCSCLGIDISEKAIELAKATAKFNNLEDRASFICGGIEALKGIRGNSFDGVILSNIIDNVMPIDAEVILENVHRIVKPKGKVLVKLNPYLTEEQLKEYGSKLIGDNLYLESDGIYLWNVDSEAWRKTLERYFVVEEYKEIYFEKFDQYNRVFYLSVKE